MSDTSATEESSADRHRRRRRRENSDDDDDDECDERSFLRPSSLSSNRTMAERDARGNQTERR